MTLNKTIWLKMLYLLATIFHYGCTPAKIFDDAEIAKKQKLSSPLSNWIIIEQFDRGHIIRALAPYRWSYKKNSNVFLNAKGEIQPFKSENEFDPQGQLGSAHMEILHTYQIDNLNKDLAKELGKTVAFTHVYLLRVFSAYSFAYDLFIYANGENVAYIMVCKDFCRETEAEIIAVTKDN